MRDPCLTRPPPLAAQQRRPESGPLGCRKWHATHLPTAELKDRAARCGEQPTSAQVTWTCVPGTNITQHLHWPESLCNAVQGHALFVAPTSARGVVQRIQTHGPHSQRRCCPIPKGWYSLEPGELQLLGSPVWLCPLPAHETWVKFTKHLGTWFPISQVPVTVETKHPAQRECSTDIHPPPNPPPNTHTHTHTHTHTAGTQLPPSSPVCLLLSSPAASAPLNDSPLP